ncbi:hypothetical protein [Verminephrobacter eiseniae]|uniref:hypothetical protein n=1 Tax=Verminephrobacter eiseniae TaxID=364317 RepID=UPI002237D949|nr:hypothetical protein [Verminephrobacter eiseniae]MCW5237887.1 hypothetical protein [Verminephrobacter eiseniae]
MQRYGQEVSSTKRGWAKELVRLKAFPHQPQFPASRLQAQLSAADIAAWRGARLRVNSHGAVLRDMVLLSHVLDVARRDLRFTHKYKLIRFA